MKNKDARWGLQQAEYLLEYDRRKIQDCVDVFRNLAAVYWQMDSGEAFLKSAGKVPDTAVEDADAGRERWLLEDTARQNRKSLAAQMRQLAGLMQDVAGTNVQMMRLGGRQERQIVRAMAGEGLTASDVFLMRGKEGKLEISITAATRWDRSVTASEIAGYLSVLLDLRLTPQKRNPYFVGTEPVTLYFEEEPAFCCMTGAASAVKEGEKISGDSFSFFEQDGSVAVLLSDGVGSGEEAEADSSQVVDLAEQILDAGLSGSMTAQLLNSLMRAKAQEEHMPTLDLCSVDLREGTARFVKAGGVCSFIRRSECVERVGEASLPLGFEKEEEIVEFSRSLESGDMVILLSDGIVQEWPGENCFEDLRRQIGLIPSTSPQDMANRLLHYAIAQCRGQIRDDMTVLALGIWENGSASEDE